MTISRPARLRKNIRPIRLPINHSHNQNPEEWSTLPSCAPVCRWRGLRPVGRHFPSSGSANTINVDPVRNPSASGHNPISALLTSDPQPVGVAIYCFPFTE